MVSIELDKRFRMNIPLNICPFEKILIQPKNNKKHDFSREDNYRICKYYLRDLSLFDRAPDPVISNLSPPALSSMR